MLERWIPGEDMLVRMDASECLMALVALSAYWDTMEPYDSIATIDGDRRAHRRALSDLFRKLYTLYYGFPPVATEWLAKAKRSKQVLE